MIFNEIYSAYYNTVSGIIAAAVEGRASEAEMKSIISQHAFAESALAIIPALKSGKWQLLHPDMSTPIVHKPDMPLSLLEKRWLKAMSLDPRIKLFGEENWDFEGVEPLFTPDDYLVYDKYSDGDPYEDEEYIRRFRLILHALREKKPIEVTTLNRKGKPFSMLLMPIRLEYSEKDDKFRLIAGGKRRTGTINLARILSCSLASDRGFSPAPPKAQEKKELTLVVRNQRNALERVLLHFAHFEKRAEQLGRNRYLVRLRYERDDETEVLIRVLSFGPMVEVIGPESFRELIIERLKKQRICGN